MCSLAACSPGRPRLAPHTAADPAALSTDEVVAETDAAVANYFALQNFYLTPKSFFKREPSSKDKKWAAKTVAAESEALSRLLPLAARLTTGPVPPRAQKEKRIYLISYAVFGLDDESAAVWETARLRANLASELLSLYWHLSAAGQTPAETKRLRDNVARADGELNGKNGR